jgi:hypothetical protein
MLRGLMMAQLTERKGYEFTIESTKELDEEQEFLALENFGRPDEFILYRHIKEGGDYEYVAAPDGKENLIEAALDWMELEGYCREDLSVRDKQGGGGMVN